jgi:hypothetical protein
MNPFFKFPEIGERRSYTETPDFHDPTSPLSGFLKAKLYTPEVLNVLLGYILKRPMRITKVTPDHITGRAPDGDTITADLFCEDTRVYDLDEASRKEYHYLRWATQYFSPETYSEQMRFVELPSTIAIHLPEEDCSIEYPFICHEVNIDSHFKGLELPMPNICTIYMRVQNTVAFSLLEVSGQWIDFDGLCELNLNMVDYLDRDANPGLAMVSDFFHFANKPEIFRKRIDEIADPKIKADAEFLAETMNRLLNEMAEGITA